jgi:hypothetical protein
VEVLEIVLHAPISRPYRWFNREMAAFNNGDIPLKLWCEEHVAVPHIERGLLGLLSATSAIHVDARRCSGAHAASKDHLPVRTHRPCNHAGRGGDG